MSVSINTSFTADMRRALSDSVSEATRASTAMATGNAFMHAYEDPTGLAIGEKMKSDHDILSIVATGIEQSQSMLYIAEAGIKSAYESVTQMNQILARAKLGYMTDELVQNTLSPSYVQLKAEVNRVADSTDFNGQKILNGTGGVKTAAVTTTVNQTPSFDLSSAVISLQDIKIANITAAVNGGTNSPLTLDTASSSVKVSGGTLTTNGTSTILTGATITVSNVGAKDGATPAKTCTSDVIITGATLTFTGQVVNGKISGAATLSATDTKNVTYGFNVRSGGTITSITNTTSTVIPTTTSASIDNIISTYTSTGGTAAQSLFKFVTGTNLNKDIVTVSFPNIRLTNKNDPTIPTGIISTLNTDGLMSSTKAAGLTNLTSVADATTDIPLVQALAKQLIICLDNVGAYQRRFLNIQSQLGSSVEQLDNAQGAILNADLATESENYARASVKVNIAISKLNSQNQMLYSLQKIVTG